MQVDADEEVVEAFGLGVDVVNVELADVGEAHCAYVLDEGEVCCFHGLLSFGCVNDATDLRAQDERCEDWCEDV